MRIRVLNVAAGSLGAASRASSPAIGATKGPREELGLVGSYLAGIHPAFRVTCA